MPLSTIGARLLSYWLIPARAVRDEKHLIRSAEGIAHWLEAKSKEDIIELSAMRLSDVLNFEPKDSCIYLRANDTVDRAREVFANDLGKRIFSALVTEHGSAEEKPINIVTPGISWEARSDESTQPCLLYL